MLLGEDVAFVGAQYRYGTTTTHALKTLYREGGVLRFYRGVGPALIQARPLLLLPVSL